VRIRAAFEPGLNLKSSEENLKFKPRHENVMLSRKEGGGFPTLYSPRGLLGTASRENNDTRIGFLKNP
jgi:hypothetical protein